jgi:signal transduction histidine kinase
MPPSLPPAEHPDKQPHERLLSRMRHDLRTPISAIVGYSELLAEGVIGEVSDAQREVIGRVAVCALELEQMLEALVTLLRLDLDVLPGPAYPETAGNLVRRALQDYAARPRAITASLEVRQDSTVHTDVSAAAGLVEALLVCCALHSGATSALVAVGVEEGRARISLSTQPATPAGFWESPGGKLAAEFGGALAAALGGSAGFGEEGEEAVVIHLPLTSGG